MWDPKPDYYIHSQTDSSIVSSFKWVAATVREVSERMGFSENEFGQPRAASEEVLRTSDGESPQQHQQHGGAARPAPTTPATVPYTLHSGTAGMVRVAPLRRQQWRSGGRPPRSTNGARPGGRRGASDRKARAGARRPPHSPGK